MPTIPILPQEGLLELASRCEQATGRDLQLGHDILVAVGQRDADALELFGPPASPYDPTASLDAAMTLVPGPDWEWSLEWETDIDGEMFAHCKMGDPMRFRDCEAKTLALAFCAAALRARADISSQGEGV